MRRGKACPGRSGDRGNPFCTIVSLNMRCCIWSQGIALWTEYFYPSSMYISEQNEEGYSMSLLLLWSSPNRDGLTAAAKEALLTGISRAGTAYEEVQLNQCAVLACRACGDGWGNCHARGECVQHDDFSQLYLAMQKAEGIVLVTPVYWHDLSENLKCLLDRVRRCETGHNHFLRGKPCLLTACAGGSGRGAVECLRRMEETTSHLGMTALERLPVTRFNRSYMLTALCGAGEAFALWLQRGKDGSA